jgi:hypothetical protein
MSVREDALHVLTFRPLATGRFFIEGDPMLRTLAVVCCVILLAGCGKPKTSSSASSQPSGVNPQGIPTSKPQPITKAEAEPEIKQILQQFVHPTEKSKIVYISEPMEPDPVALDLYSKYGIHDFYVTRSDYLLGEKDPTYYQYLIAVGHKDGKPYAAGYIELKDVISDPKRKDWLAKYPPPKPPASTDKK